MITQRSRLIRHAGVGECRHPSVAGKRRAQNEHREGGARRLAKPHAQIENRIETEFGEQHFVPGLCRGVRRGSVRQCVRPYVCERRHSCRANEPIEQNRDVLLPSREDCAENGSKFASTQRRRDPQRVTERPFVSRECLIDRPLLAGEASIVDTGTATSPARAPSAKESRRNRGSSCRVANTHFADADEVGFGRHRIMASCDRGEKGTFVHRRFQREIRSRLVERQRNHTQRSMGDLRKLIDGRSTGCEVRDHLGCDLCWVGRHALRGDTVVSCEDQYVDAVKPGRAAALPAREPRNKILQSAETARRLCQLSLSRSDPLGRTRISCRQVKTGGTQFGEGRKAGHGNLSGRRHHPVRAAL
jgi:hypothetical protein